MNLEYEMNCNRIVVSELEEMCRETFTDEEIKLGNGNFLVVSELKSQSQLNTGYITKDFQINDDKVLNYLNMYKDVLQIYLGSKGYKILEDWEYKK